MFKSKVWKDIWFKHYDLFVHNKSIKRSTKEFIIQVLINVNVHRPLKKKKNQHVQVIGIR